MPKTTARSCRCARTSGSAGVAFRDVLTTSDTTPLERYVVEHKFYGKGVGPVLAIEASPAPSGRS